jgi:aminopeptidase N
VSRLLVLALVLAACTSQGTAGDPAPETSAPTVTTSVGDSEELAVEGQRGSAGIGDRLYPELGNGGYDVLRYRFDLDVDSEWSIQATADIELVPLVDLGSFNFDLAGLDVTEVRVDGFDDVRFEQLGRELVIDLGSPAPADQAIAVLVRYAGVPESVAADAVPFRPGWQLGEEVAYLFSQPDGAQSLFPVNDHPLDRADVELTVTTDPGLEVISGGELMFATGNDESATVTWEMKDIAPYLIPLGIGDFTLDSDREFDGVRYDVWVSDDLLEAPAIDAFDIQPEIVAFFEERFGPYPFDRAGALIVDDELGAALETQTIPTYTARSMQWGEVVIAHELAHQWFGNSIALAQWDDIWLNEGLSTFAHWIWLEESRGTDRYDSEVENAYRMLSGLELVGNGIEPAEAVDRVRDAFPPPDDPRPADLFNRSVYERGGLTFVALRDAVGDEPVFELLRTYTARYSGETITTEAFLALVDEVLGAGSRMLVEAWVLDVDIPAMPERGLEPPGMG